MLWMGLLHRNLRQRGRLQSRVPPWVAGISWIVPVVNLILPYLLLLGYATTIPMQRSVRTMIYVLWVVDVVFYAGLIGTAVVPDLSAQWLVLAELAQAILGPVGLVLIGYIVFAITRRLPRS